MERRVFLTGINGYLGSHIAVRLARRGYRITGLIRKTIDAPVLRDCPFNVCIGDIREPRSYREALKGCEAVIHTAAETAFGFKDARQYYEINWKGTEILLENAAHAGIRRFIHAGTRGTIGVAKIPEQSVETSPARKMHEGEDYLKSKFLAEEAVRRYSRRQGMACLVLSPTALAGGCDYKPSPAGHIIYSYLRGRIHVYMAGGINVVDVEDAAEAFVNALERGDNGQTYILGNTNIPLKELFRQLALIRKKPRRLIKVPFPCAYAAAWGIEGISNCLRIPAFVTRHKVVSLYNNYSYCSAQKAVGTLALPQTPLEMTLEKAAAWFLRDS